MRGRQWADVRAILHTIRVFTLPYSLEQTQVANCVWFIVLCVSIWCVIGANCEYVFAFGFQFTAHSRWCEVIFVIARLLQGCCVQPIAGARLVDVVFVVASQEFHAFWHPVSPMIFRARTAQYTENRSLIATMMIIPSIQTFHIRAFCTRGERKKNYNRNYPRNTIVWYFGCKARVPCCAVYDVRVPHLRKTLLEAQLQKANVNHILK